MVEKDYHLEFHKQILWEFVATTIMPLIGGKRKFKMIRWGITANSHDASMAVFDNNDLLWAAHAERSSGIKNDKFLNETIVNQALEFGYPDEMLV